MYRHEECLNIFKSKIYVIDKFSTTNDKTAVQTLSFDK